jgi:hypothetical protein
MPRSGVPGASPVANALEVADIYMILDFGE